MDKTVKKIYKHKNIPAEFHDITLSIEDSGYFAQPHWHNGIEILFIKSGTAETLIDDKVIQETSGDIVLVNADTLHSTRAVIDNTKYYCIILSNAACEEFGFSVNNLYIQTKINDSRLFSMVNELCEEFAEERKYYTAVVTAKILEIVAILLRNYSFEKKCTKPKANVAVCAIISILAITQTGFMLPLAATAGYAFLTIRVDDVSIMMFIQSAWRYFAKQQYYEWRMDDDE